MEHASISSLTITESALVEMLAHFRRELPREGCGFLAGTRNRAHRFYPINNLTPDLRRFSMDPLHVKRTEVSIFRRNQRILAVCHSHPDGDCYPSRYDVESAFFDAALRWPYWEKEVQIIALLSDPDAPLVKGFRYRIGGEVEEVELRTFPSEVGNISTSP